MTTTEAVLLTVLGATFVGISVFLASLARSMRQPRDKEAERIARTIHHSCAECGRVLEFRRKP